ncbi:unnamed protein product [Clonostachys byssicola]|uniref:Tat pathway signal sequence n=1 Tax=Clonostachys byssicola TaxID=160290 RepID=A0A9N9UBM4_9HYPO|nr:unnamed protein product [Clonostachys byssicola]
MAPMPPIAEDEVVGKPMVLPRGPLRIPQKTRRGPMNRPAPPPYVPAPHHFPPLYMEDKDTMSDSSSTSGIGSLKLENYKNWQDESGSDYEGHGRSLKDRQWFGSRLGRWLKFGFLALMAVGIVVGLAVGLTFGLRDKFSSDGSNGTDSSSLYPVGSYSFESTLQNISTACTSRSSTWRCYPYSQGSNATFFWSISRSGSSYNVSSSDNPFAPSFSNKTATLLDQGEPTERLSFAFDTSRTIIPSEPITPTNRAAKCTYSSTLFQATIWTRRSGGRELSDIDDLLKRKAGKKFVAWPGDVQVLQMRPYKAGGPNCEDTDGNKITDIQGGYGDCSCEYSSF